MQCTCTCIIDHLNFFAYFISLITIKVVNIFIVKMYLIYISTLTLQKNGLTLVENKVSRYNHCLTFYIALLILFSC